MTKKILIVEDEEKLASNLAGEAACRGVPTYIPRMMAKVVGNLRKARLSICLC